VADLHGARVLVTGATGLIGANLVPRLETLGCDVGAVVRRTGVVPPTWQRVTHFVADLRDLQATTASMRAFAPTHVVSAAMPTGHAKSPGERREAVEVGVLATARLLDLAAETAVRRFVQVGSSLEYRPSSRPLREDDPLMPTTFRGVVKAAASLLALQRARTGEISAVVVRPFSVYGPWERNGRLVPAALKAALHGRPLALTADDPVRDFVFVDDVVDGIVAALRAGDAVSGRVVNLGTGVETSNRGLLPIVERVTGRAIARAPERHPPRPPDVPHWCADTTLARNLLGWAARTDLPTGLAATARWLDEAAVA
jgi:nucleoside-diphosphate-sugar epimerase